jgi:nucleoside-diphosphate-sugar epimerase
MKILVTGGSGFLGSAFIRQVSSLHYDLLAIGRNAPRICEIDDRVSYLYGSFIEAPWKEIERFAPDVCVHFAWGSSSQNYLDSEENSFLADATLSFVDGLENLGCCKFLGMGSCLEYKSSPMPLTEDAPPCPFPTAYGLAKRRLADCLTQKSSGIECSWLRIFHAYGPGEPSRKLITQLLVSSQTNDPITLRSPADVVDYIHVDDVISAIVCLLHRESKGIWNVGSGIGISIADIAKLVTKFQGRIARNQNTKQAEISCRIADNSKLRAAGWFPQVPLHVGIQQMQACRGSGFSAYSV